MKKTIRKKRTLARPAKTSPKKKPTRSTALARATAAIQQANSTAALVPAKDAEPDASMVLRDEPYLANFGSDPPTFTPKQEAILNESVPEQEVLILPTGQPYLPHMAYALWLDKAFGRTGWVLRPMANPRRIEEGGEKVRVFLQQPFGLYIGGKMAAWAYGVAEYHESNRDQNYGDVLEALQSFGLRRCCKHLRIGPELWNKAWLQAWRDRHCVQVKVQWRNGKTFPQWRRRLDPPLPEETGIWTDRDQPRTYERSGDAPRQFAPSTSTEPITEPQLKRLIAIARGRGVTDERLKAWLVEHLPYTKRADGVVSKKRIQKKDYERVCTAVEAGFQQDEPAAEEPARTVTADDIDWDPRFANADDRGPRW